MKRGRMRILMLLPRFPYPPERGDTLRSWTVLQGLSGRHEVWLACVDSRMPTREQLAPVREVCREVAVFARSAAARVLGGVRSVLAGGSFTEGYFADWRLRRTLAEWSAQEPFDALFTYSSSIAPLAREVRARRRVMDLCDVDSQKWTRYSREAPPPLRWCYRLEAERVADLEVWAAGRHDVCLTVNERECKKLHLLAPQAVVEVVPTPVKVEPTGNGPPPTAPVIGMLGSMCYPPNVLAVDWFGRFVWPLVQHRLPEARWLIVGRDPVRSVRKWSRLPGVMVTGRVPDVRPYLAQMRVFVDPVRGDIGVQTKLLVALANGRPAVTTSDAVAGLTYSGPPPCLVANTPADFASAIVRLTLDVELWHSLSRRGRELIEQKHASQVETVEQVLTAGRPAAVRRGNGRALVTA